MAISAAMGRPIGLYPVFFAAAPGELAGRYGLLSHYRFLDDQARYGVAAWDWASTAKLDESGAVHVLWTQDSEHPFRLEALYRWQDPNVLDLLTTVTAGKPLCRFEVFLASYFQGFDESFVLVESSPELGGKKGFLPARKEDGHWHIFPRDREAVGIIQDGRWDRPPHPVRWEIRPFYAAPWPTGATPDGIVGVLMASPQECFAVATPYSGESHCSIYLSLFGRDLQPGESASARTRLVICPWQGEDEILRLFEGFCSQG